MKPVPIEASIRPVIPRVKYANDPTAVTAIHAVTASGTYNMDVQPPAGVKWLLNYALEIIVVGGTMTTSTATIEIFDGTNWVAAAAKAPADFQGAGTSISLASFGNGPILLTNEKYLRVRFVMTSNQDATVHMLALVEPV